MREKRFHCHMCDQDLPGDPKMRVALIGFCWEPSLNENPGQLLDVCEACQHALLKAYAKAKNERIEAVYEKNKIEWLREKMNGLEKAKNRIPAGSASSSRLSPMQEAAADRARWNYSNKEKQQIWGF